MGKRSPIKDSCAYRQAMKRLSVLWHRHDRLLGDYIVLATALAEDNPEHQTRDLLVDMQEIADKIEKLLKTKKRESKGML